MNVSCLMCHARNPSANVFSSVFARENARARSSCPASVSGRNVNFRLTICSWWNWHICTGISENTAGIPILPSKTTAVRWTPFDTTCALRSAYACFVSCCIHAQPRFAFRCGARATSTRSPPRCVASKTQTASWGTRSTPMRFGIRSIILRIVFSPRSYVDFKSATVCRFHTWSCHIFRSSLCGRRLLWNCLPQSLHL